MAGPQSELLPVHTTMLGLDRRFYGFWKWTFPWGGYLTYIQIAAIVSTLLVVVTGAAALLIVFGVLLNPALWFPLGFGAPYLAQKIVSISSERMDYKRPHEWLTTMLRYRLGSKHYAGLRPTPGPRSYALRVTLWRPRRNAAAVRPARAPRRQEEEPRWSPREAHEAYVAARGQHPMEGMARLRMQYEPPRSRNRVNVVGGLAFLCLLAAAGAYALSTWKFA
ncbi:MAG TPA: hypothetical protein VH208_07340 [Myxococcaceae bacterium]|nr:hypothetical protein [Myxococcaceae bacterium]